MKKMIHFVDAAGTDEHFIPASEIYTIKVADATSVICYVTSLDPAVAAFGNVDLTVKSRPYPTATQTSHGPYEITTSTTKQDTRIRGRQLALRVSSDAVDDKWRYGTMRFDGKADGARGG